MAATMLLLTGLAATLSRAGIAAFLLGLLVLCWLLGVTSVLTQVWPAVAGAIVATLGLVPGMLASGPSRPVWACTGLVAGLGIAVAPWHHFRRLPFHRRTNRFLERSKFTHTAVATVFLVIFLGALVIGLGRNSSVWSGRLSLASPDRTSVADAALRVWDKHLLTGVGPGQTVFIWTTDEHRVLFDRFAHDEYLQLAVEEGIVGLAGLAVLVAGAAVTLVRGWKSIGAGSGKRPAPPGPASVNAALAAGAIAGLIAFGFHSAFDFLWHVPLVPLLAATAFGFASAPAGATNYRKTTATH
jgi:hypothetical protein